MPTAVVAKARAWGKAKVVAKEMEKASAVEVLVGAQVGVTIGAIVGVVMVVGAGMPAGKAARDGEPQVLGLADTVVVNVIILTEVAKAERVTFVWALLSM
mmetsp:Transcript_48504/g.81571  ORF Transcript_48504/g.81571 Transcript_48504/m.81571 type:complete len:100 (+) Transcript_48504:189-488(+)